MVTRCVTACIVSGALASAVTPGELLVTPGHARKEVVKVGRGSRAPRAFQPIAGSVHPECMHTASSVERAAATKPMADQQTRQTEPRLASTQEQCPATTDAALSVPVAVQSQRPVRPTTQRHIGRFRMTAYTQYHSPLEKTASGRVPAAGRTVAVDPRVIPLGTRIHIEGIGIRVAEDTGRKIKGRKLDLFLPSIRSCMRFGVRTHDVYVVD